jgi:hypothetical protein
MSGVGVPKGIRELGARGRSEWVASILAAVDSVAGRETGFGLFPECRRQLAARHGG